MNVLVGDVGGTKTALAIVSSEKGPRSLANERHFLCAQYDSVDEIIHAYLSDAAVQIDAICLVVAGPVIDGKAKITNLPWVMEEAHLAAKFNVARAKLLNDLEGMAYAVPILSEEDVFTLSPGIAVSGGSIAVIAPGTGLGEAYLTKEHVNYCAHASEGGHASFSPINAIQIELLGFLQQKKGLEHVSMERVCSGALGIPNLYTFLKETGKYPEPAWLAQKLADGVDMAPVIFSTAQDTDNPSELCVATLDLFCSILAVEAGNLALKILSTGGIYLGGGIPPRILGLLQQPEFLATLRRKGRFEGLLTQMPVKVILNTKAPLMGAGEYGLR
ncbi:MAG: glucokinase [Chloroflexota bacterium]|jgi:glucokinase